MATRNFQRMQAASQDLVKLIGEIATSVAVAPSGVTTTLTNQLTIASKTLTTARNGNTVSIAISAAAANPTNKVLINVTGTAAAVIITVIPNDGTNNTATPVNITTAQLGEFIRTGAISGKSLTITDTGSLMADLTATGGGAQNVVHAAEADGASVTLSGGHAAIYTVKSNTGFSDISYTSTGLYTFTLAERFVKLMGAKVRMTKLAAQDLNAQIISEAVASADGTGTVVVALMTGGTKTDPSADSTVTLELLVKHRDSK